MLSLETSLQLRIGGRFEPFRAISGEASSVSARVTLAAGFRAGLAGALGVDSSDDGGRVPICFTANGSGGARRPTDARTQLRAALETFECAEATPWADRTRNELRAAGEITVRRTSADPFRRLTPQELQFVRLAATGATNREIAGQLFLSPRTVGYHLYKAYPKLGVSSSRRGLVDLDLRP